MNRREFLKSSAAGIALAGMGGYVAGAADSKPLRVGLIGTGWYGKCDLFRLIQVSPVEVVSLCDVDRKMLEDAAEQVAARQASHKKPRLYTDYREMLKEKDLDAVEVATPDHWHALPMIAACEAGMDVYCQKPISVDVVEGQAMLAAARKHNRVVQIGTQRRSTPHLIEAREKIIKSGMLGKIGAVEIYCYYHMRANDRTDVTTPPEGFDYEMWTGPAPLRPYDAPPNKNEGDRRVPHRRWWRTFMEYGNGIMGDMCVHMLDMVRWMLDLGWPTRISSSGGIIVDKGGKSNIYDTQTAVFDFDGMPVTWEHRSWGDPPDKRFPWGATIFGDKGTLTANVMYYEFTPAGKKEPTIHKDVVMELDQYPIDKTEKDLERHVAPAIRGHMKNWLECIGTRGRPVADIEQGFISSASCIMANDAVKLGRSITYDPGKGECVNDPEATRMLRRPYRGPWQHPEPGQTA